MKFLVLLAACLATFGCAYSAALGVINGDEVPKNSIPYQVHLYMLGDFLQQWNCTGVLLSGRYILTTSKCEWSGPTNVNVTVGAHNIAESESTQQAIYASGSHVDWKIYDVDFAYYTLENNIGIVRLLTPFTLNEYVQVAKLATTDNVKVGQSGTISGWGFNGQGVETVLKKATVKVVDNSVCAEAYPNLYTGEKTICVLGDDRASACNDDDGAPLVIDGVVVGLYSGGPVYVQGYNKDCSGQPNIFTKITSYLDWIVDHSDINL